VGIPVLAPHFGPQREEFPVLSRRDVLLKGFCKAWPSRPGVILVKRAEERLPRCDINVDPLPLIIMVFILEGRLRAFVLRYLVLKRCELLFQGGVIGLGIGLRSPRVAAGVGARLLRLSPGLIEELIPARACAIDLIPYRALLVVILVVELGLVEP
jgi:hypothetical protein